MASLMKSLTALVVLGLLALSCAEAHVGYSSGGWMLHIVGKDGAIIVAEGLEDAKNQVFEYVKELQAQVPKDQEAIDDWELTYSEILKKKTGSRTDGTANSESMKKGSVGKPK